MLKLICALLVCASFAFAADVSGTWQMTVETSQGSGTPTVVFQQKGEQLTGTLNSQIFGEVKIAGSVKGNAIEFGFEGEAGGQTHQGRLQGHHREPDRHEGHGRVRGFRGRGNLVGDQEVNLPHRAPSARLSRSLHE